MEYRDALYKLTVFNENAKEIGDSGFVRWMKKHQVMRCHYEEGKRDSLPRYESVKAFILTFRKFYQNNDPCSLGNMSQLYSQEYVSDDLRNRFENVRTVFNEHLGGSCCIKIYKNKTEIVLKNKKELLETLIYGKFAHGSEGKGYIARTLLKDRWLKLHIWPEFLGDLFVCSNLIQEIRHINKKTISDIKKRQEE